MDRSACPRLWTGTGFYVVAMAIISAINHFQRRTCTHTIIEAAFCRTSWSISTACGVMANENLLEEYRQASILGPWYALLS